MFGLLCLIAVLVSCRDYPPFAGEKQFTMTALDDYVSKPDPHYKWEYLDQEDYGDAVVYWLNLTSQQWMDESYVHNSIWTHFLGIIVPSTLPKPNNPVETIDLLGVMYIAGGHTGKHPDRNDEELLMMMEVVTTVGTVGAILYQIPNEPLYFTAEKPPHGRSEDGAIAYTWWDFMVNHKPGEVLLRCPMVKAAIRALDASEAFVQGYLLGYRIQEWGVSGASKRGWTTWMAGAYDAAHEKRIKAIMPLVMSFLNMSAQFHTWWRMMGGWSWALDDYWTMNLTDLIGSTRIPAMAQVIDPYEYRERFTDMILYEGMSTEDEFFTLLDPRNYWDGMPFKEKFLLLIPNAEHSLATGLLTILPSMTAFYHSIAYNSPRPKISWEFDEPHNKLTLYTSETPSRVKLWKAYTWLEVGERMDFRCLTADDPCPSQLIVQGMCVLPILWLSEEVPVAQGQLKFEAVVPNNEDNKYTGFFFEALFEVPGIAQQLEFMTAAMVVPLEFPYKDCVKGEACKGKLV